MNWVKYTESAWKRYGWKSYRPEGPLTGEVTPNEVIRLIEEELNNGTTR